MTEELHNVYKPYFDTLKELCKRRSAILDKMDEKFIQDQCDHEYDAWLGTTPQPCKKCGKLCKHMDVKC